MNDLWTCIQTSKPVVNSDLAGKCSKCNGDQVILKHEDRDGTDWLEVTCYVCGYAWTVDPADKRKKGVSNENH